MALFKEGLNQGMQRVKKFLTFGFLILAFGSIASAVVVSMHSSLFIVHAVEVEDQPEDSPMSASDIISLASVPIGKLNLFQLNLKQVESRIRTSSWIKDVRLQKMPPQTLSVAVTYREPKALLQTETGSVVYVDGDGKRFGKVNLRYRADLTLLSGMGSSDTARAKDAIFFLQRWEKLKISKKAEISSISWDFDRGYRAVLTYSMGDRIGRTWLDLGQNFDTQTDLHLERLSKVIEYLSGHGVAVRQIWADAGKKIVVKTAHGS